MLVLLPSFATSATWSYERCHVTRRRIHVCLPQKPLASIMSGWNVIVSTFVLMPSMDLRFVYS